MICTLYACSGRGAIAAESAQASTSYVSHGQLSFSGQRTTHIAGSAGRSQQHEPLRYLFREVGPRLHRAERAASKPISASLESRPQVVVTREKGKNGKLMKALEQRGISVLELPLVETAEGPDRQLLPQLLQEEQFDWVIVTSPESASVFLEGWRAAGKPSVRLAVVGGGTGVVIEAAGEPSLQVAFTPSKANADHLGAELPYEGSGRVLYPASAKAGCTLQAGLSARGFLVRRLNTYNTVPVQSLPESALASAKLASVVAFASPSAVKAWLACAGGQDKADVAIACIGSTSAQAAERLGLKRIFYPESPGLEGFVDSILEALEASTPSAALAA